MLIQISSKKAGEIANNVTRMIVINPKDIKFEHDELGREYEPGTIIMFISYSKKQQASHVYIRQVLRVHDINHKKIIEFFVPDVDEQLQHFKDCMRSDKFYKQSLIMPETYLWTSEKTTAYGPVFQYSKKTGGLIYND